MGASSKGIIMMNLNRFDSLVCTRGSALGVCSPRTQHRCWWILNYSAVSSLLDELFLLVIYFLWEGGGGEISIHGVILWIQREGARWIRHAVTQCLNPSNEAHQVARKFRVQILVRKTAKYPFVCWDFYSALVIQCTPPYKHWEEKKKQASAGTRLNRTCTRRRDWLKKKKIQARFNKREGRSDPNGYPVR